MKKVLANVEDERLRAYVIWMTAFARDSHGVAAVREQELNDPRVKQYWDGENATGRGWMAVLNLPMPAWDVYFLYGVEAKWDDAPGQPAFLLHQLGDALPMENHLRREGSVERFEERAKKLLELAK